MLRRLVIDDFRALRHFEMAGLGRINLLVGTNNWVLSRPLLKVSSG